MLGALISAQRFLHTNSFFCSIFEHCLSSTNPLIHIKLAHARYLKLGLNSNTFLGNCLIDLYSKFGATNDALKTFHDISLKNVVSWNLRLKISVKHYDIHTAHHLFDAMPERDTVSWNTLISGYISGGFFESAWEIFLHMPNNGVRPSQFTFTLLFSCGMCSSYAKELHGYMVRSGVDNFNVVVGNSLIDAYGKLGLLDYALAVFSSIKNVDLISWNSLISGCCKSGYEALALQQFSMMGSAGYRPDEYTVSMVLNACSNLKNLGKGIQIFCFGIKMGFLQNTIVSSAAIDMFSGCNRIERAIRVFETSCVLDSALSNSMIASYASHGLEEDALYLFRLSLRKDIKPTEFTFSCVLSSATVFLSMEQGTQIHSLVIKFGFEMDAIVASSLVAMYSEYGLIEVAVNVFDNMAVRDLIAWNTMILGMTNHGKLVDSICLFVKLLESGLHPDHITFVGVLSACCNGGFVEAGMAIFSSMEKQFGVKPFHEHYACLLDLMSEAGKLEEAIDLLQMVKCVPNTPMYEAILRSCLDYRNLDLIERLVERLLDMGSPSLLPYMILANAYKQRGRWESLVRVRKEMEKMTRKKAVGLSWIGIKGRVFSFAGNHTFHHYKKDLYSVLQILAQDISDKTNTYQPTSDWHLREG